MELSFLLNYLCKQRGTTAQRKIEESAKLVYNAGFRYVDYTPDFMCQDYLRKANHDYEVLTTQGIAVEQTHAPINRYCTYDNMDFKRLFMNAFEVSKAVQAKYVVVHADEYRTKDRYDSKEACRQAYEFLSPYVEYAAKTGMTVAIENVFDDNMWPLFDGKSRYTSRMEELLEIIEKFNTPEVKCCWDFGHAKCAFGANNMLDQLRQVSKYLVCTHVHDNYYGKDFHLMPFLGDIEWEPHIKYLNEIGYKGKFSFEFVYGSIPDALLPMLLKAAYDVGDYLVSQCQ